MPIEALPTTTISAIGSTQALTDPASLVKELIDNAIDGRATTISVEISANALDELRVKDDGHGIAPDDRSKICIRHCTSKIRDLNDLREIGGTSLGFRGEALASAAEMSGTLRISTRIEGEETASELKFDRRGHIASEKRTSHPKGTTVRVERFLEFIPVRRQAAEKSSIKVLAKVKRMLQAYALARPYLRLSLKILSAKNDKGNWKYPKIAGVGDSKLKRSALNAATDIMGVKVTDECQQTSSIWSSAGEEIGLVSEALGHNANEDETYTFEVVLIKPDCNGSIVSGIGQYLSVDSRPVSCARGTLKQIASTYKTRVRSVSHTSDDTKVTDPLLCMNIVCPLGSYDANVEPAKDDVLFANADLVLRLAEKFFKSIYGEPLPGSPKAAAGAAPIASRGIELMLAKKAPLIGRESLASRSSAGPLSKIFMLSHEPAPRLRDYSASLMPGIRVTQNLAPSLEPKCQPCRSPKGSKVAAPDKLRISDNELLSTWIGSNDCFSGTSPEVSSEVLRALSPSSRPAWKPSMYSNDDDDDGEEEPDLASSEPARPVQEEDVEGEDDLRSVQVSNPWAFAKLNAPFRPPGRNQQKIPDNGHNPQLPTPSRQKGDAGDHPSDLSTLPASELPTSRRFQRHAPTPSSLSSPSPFPYPQRSWGKRKTDDQQVPLPPIQKRYGRGSLDTWVRQSPRSRPGSPDFSDDDEADEGNPGPPDVRYPGPFVSARSLTTGTPLSGIPDGSQGLRRKAPQRKQQQQGAPNKTIISAVNDPEPVWFDTGEKPMSRQPKQTHPTQRKQQKSAGTIDALMLRDDEDSEFVVSESLQLPQARIHPDLALTLDYEARKQDATQKYRRIRREDTTAGKKNTKTLGDNPGTQTTSPHNNRQRAAIAALHTKDDPSPFPSLPSHGETSSFPPNDPRAYLIRVQHSENSRQPGPERGKLRRRKNTLLPLETLPQETYVGNLIQFISIPAMDIENRITNSSAVDDFIRDGIISTAFPISPTASPPPAASVKEIRILEQKLKDLVKTSYRFEGMAPEEEMDGELDVDLVEILQRNNASDAVD